MFYHTDLVSFVTYVSNTKCHVVLCRQGFYAKLFACNKAYFLSVVEAMSVLV